MVLPLDHAKEVRVAGDILDRTEQEEPFELKRIVEHRHQLPLKIFDTSIVCS
jgi:hypothetical protein